MKEATLREVQARLGDYVKTSAAQPVLIVERGEPVAMLVGLGRRKKRAPVKLREVLKRAWKDYEKYGGMGHEQFWNELAKDSNSRP
ncbi:MAG: type II toxin-antitoxin system prevent-host-death family antitoxin [Gemmataceae bacterium]|nr:type II toxin-antitoxin system prevent-host-death family antitoxin [Gemmataceae bacterium]